MAAVNDYSRGLAVLGAQRVLHQQIGHEAASKILLIMSGVLRACWAPHLTVISRSSENAFSGKFASLDRRHLGVLLSS